MRNKEAVDRLDDVPLRRPGAPKLGVETPGATPPSRWPPHDETRHEGHRAPGPNRVHAHPDDGRDFEALVRYMMRSPVSLSRLCFTPGAKQVVYTRKGGHDASEPGEDERVDADEFVARVLVQIPDPRRHLVRYYGAYSNRARAQRLKAEARLEGNGSSEAEEPIPPPPERAALRRRWANLIRRVYEVDPLVCPRCGAEMGVIGFITEPSLVKRILDHIRRRDRVSRPPPRPRPAVAHIA